MPEDMIGRLLRLGQAAQLPGLERGTSYGTAAIKLGKKFLAREKDATTLVMHCAVDEKAMLIEAEPQFYFETDHYRGYDAILIRMDIIDDARLSARLEQAWKARSPFLKKRTKKLSSL